MLSNGLTRILMITAMTAFVSACASTPDPELTSDPAVVDTPSQPVAVPTPEVEPMGPLTGSQADLDATAGDRVFFEFDSSELSPLSRRTLRAQAEWMRANSGVNTTLEGHADERGTREYNLALGDRRATAAKNYLVALGISESRISTISYGKERLEDAGHSEAAHSKNRRSVMVVN